MSAVVANGGSYTGRTAWARSIPTPLRAFLTTETGGAAVLLAAALAALGWVNVHAASYEEIWATRLALELGDFGVSLSLREWVNHGLMTFFFFVIAHETRREFDLGELRERRRFLLPLLAALGGILSSVAIYLAFTAGSAAAHGWGVVLATDTAFALGVLAIAGPRFSDRLRAAFVHPEGEPYQTCINRSGRPPRQVEIHARSRLRSARPSEARSRELRLRKGSPAVRSRATASASSGVTVSRNRLTPERRRSFRNPPSSRGVQDASHAGIRRRSTSATHCAGLTT
jgi:Na+/H+ antiporter 1